MYDTLGQQDQILLSNIFNNGGIVQDQYLMQTEYFNVDSIHEFQKKNLSQKEIEDLNLYYFNHAGIDGIIKKFLNIRNSIGLATHVECKEEDFLGYGQYFNSLSADHSMSKYTNPLVRAVVSTNYHSKSMGEFTDFFNLNYMDSQVAKNIMTYVVDAYVNSELFDLIDGVCANSVRQIFSKMDPLQESIIQEKFRLFCEALIYKLMFYKLERVHKTEVGDILELMGADSSFYLLNGQEENKHPAEAFHHEYRPYNILSHANPNPQLISYYTIDGLVDTEVDKHRSTGQGNVILRSFVPISTGITLTKSGMQFLDHFVEGESDPIKKIMTVKNKIISGLSLDLSDVKNDTVEFFERYSRMSMHMKMLEILYDFAINFTQHNSEAQKNLATEQKNNYYNRYTLAYERTALKSELILLYMKIKHFIKLSNTGTEESIYTLLNDFMPSLRRQILSKFSNLPASSLVHFFNIWRGLVLEKLPKAYYKIPLDFKLLEIIRFAFAAGFYALSVESKNKLFNNFRLLAKIILFWDGHTIFEKVLHKFLNCALMKPFLSLAGLNIQKEDLQSEYAAQIQIALNEFTTNETLKSIITNEKFKNFMVWVSNVCLAVLVALNNAYCDYLKVDKIATLTSLINTFELFIFNIKVKILHVVFKCYAYVIDSLEYYSIRLMSCTLKKDISNTIFAEISKSNWVNLIYNSLKPNSQAKKNLLFLLILDRLEELWAYHKLNTTGNQVVGSNQVVGMGKIAEKILDFQTKNKNVLMDKKKLFNAINTLLKNDSSIEQESVKAIKIFYLEYADKIKKFDASSLDFVPIGMKGYFHVPSPASSDIKSDNLSAQSENLPEQPPTLLPVGKV